jgi:hypothetical protein
MYITTLKRLRPAFALLSEPTSKDHFVHIVVARQEVKYQVTIREIELMVILQANPQPVIKVNDMLGWNKVSHKNIVPAFETNAFCRPSQG